MDFVFRLGRSRFLKERNNDDDRQQVYGLYLSMVSGDSMDLKETREHGTKVSGVRTKKVFGSWGFRVQLTSNNKEKCLECSNDIAMTRIQDDNVLTFSMQRGSKA